MPDVSRHDPPQSDELHTMTLTDLETRVAAAGVLISRRQLMRHCESGTFDAKRMPAVNNLTQWFVAPESVDKGIADIKTLQEQRARRDASRPAMTGHDQLENAEQFGNDTTRHDASQPVVSDKQTEAGVGHPSTPVVTGHVATDLDIYQHPYVLKLEERCERLEAKYEAQVRRTEEIQLNSQQQLVELQRMTAVGQSQTLANFMLQAKDWILGKGSSPKPTEVPEAPLT